MKIRYHPGTDADFVAHIKSLPAERKELRGIDGKKRWVVDGEYILRPQSAHE